MKNFILFLPLLLVSCSTKKNFPNKDVCYLLYNLSTERFVEVFNEPRCKERFPAASTFKVALSVMAFDSDIFQDEKAPVFKWNGHKWPIENWNKDHSPLTWMQDSAIWVSQLVTPKLGHDKIERYLQDFQYGNRDFSGGLKYAWLTPAPFIHEPMQNSLKISGYEQVSFMTHLWRNELKAKPEAQKLTKKLLSSDKSPQGNILKGKTGSGFKDENHDLRLGWFVGHLKVQKDEYIIVINFTDKQKQTAVSFGGREAKEMAFKLLSEKGLW